MTNNSKSKQLTCKIQQKFINSKKLTEIKYTNNNGNKTKIESDNKNAKTFSLLDIPKSK